MLIAAESERTIAFVQASFLNVFFPLRKTGWHEPNNQILTMLEGYDFREAGKVSVKCADPFIHFNRRHSKIDSGGFGCVYRATRTDDGEEVAFKVLEAFIALAHSYWVVIVRLLWSLTVISCSRPALHSRSPISDCLRTR